MNLVRLEPGQLWHVTWIDNDSILPGRHGRDYLILLLWWDEKETQWWIIKRWSDHRMRVYPSANMWNEKMIDLDRTSDTYKYTRIA